MSRNSQIQEVIVTPELISVSTSHDLSMSWYTFDLGDEEVIVPATSEQEARRLLPYHLQGWYEAY